MKWVAQNGKYEVVKWLEENKIDKIFDING